MIIASPKQSKADWFGSQTDVWLSMIDSIIGAMLIMMNIWQNSHAVLLSRAAARRNAFGVSPSCNHYNRRMGYEQKR